MLQCPKRQHSVSSEAFPPQATANPPPQHNGQQHTLTKVPLILQAEEHLQLKQSNMMNQLKLNRQQALKR